MGLLDKNDRIIDLVLPSEGRRQLSLGELEFKYFSVFDDEVDYDPYVANSGSLPPAMNRVSSVEPAVLLEKPMPNS